jgi:hypothetical protein
MAPKDCPNHLKNLLRSIICDNFSEHPPKNMHWTYLCFHNFQFIKFNLILYETINFRMYKFCKIIKWVFIVESDQPTSFQIVRKSWDDLNHDLVISRFYCINFVNTMLCVLFGFLALPTWLWEYNDKADELARIDSSSGFLGRDRCLLLSTGWAKSTIKTLGRNKHQPVKPSCI